MSRAREVWDRLKRELAGPLSQHSPMAATPTHVMVVELDWPEDGRFFLLRNGRLRKTCKAGSKRGPNWQQELLYRSVKQKNENLLPTPELCEDFMGFPRGWTDVCATGPEDEADAEAQQKIRGPRFHQKRRRSATPQCRTFRCCWGSTSSYARPGLRGAQATALRNLRRTA